MSVGDGISIVFFSVNDISATRLSGLRLMVPRSECCSGISGSDSAFIVSIFSDPSDKDIMREEDSGIFRLLSSEYIRLFSGFSCFLSITGLSDSVF